MKKLFVSARHKSFQTYVLGPRLMEQVKDNKTRTVKAAGYFLVRSDLKRALDELRGNPLSTKVAVNSNDSSNSALMSIEHKSGSGIKIGCNQFNYRESKKLIKWSRSSFNLWV